MLSQLDSGISLASSDAPNSAPALPSAPPSSDTDGALHPVRTLPDLFDPEQFVATTELDAAIAAAETAFRYERREVAVAQLSLDDDLTLQLDGRPYRLTEKALDDLCTILDTPIPFAHRIPADVLALLVGRLRLLHIQSIVLIVREGVVVGMLDPAKWTHSRAKIHRPTFRPVTNGEALRLIKNVWSQRVERLLICLGDAGLSVQVVSGDLAIEPKVGDITRVGLSLTSSETGGPFPQARGHTLRLVCLNGATVPEPFGLARFSSDWRVNFERRLDAFQADLGRLTVDFARLDQAYSRIVATELTDLAYYNLYRQVRYVFRHATRGDALADHALGVAPQQRLALIGQVRQRQAALRDLTAGEATAGRPSPSGLLAWDLFNHLTAAARDEREFRRRVGLERVAGDLLQHAVPRS